MGVKIKRLSLFLGLTLFLGLCCATPQEALDIGDSGTGPTEITVDFSISPTEIDQGETATLVWNVTGATSVEIDNSLGLVVDSGAMDVFPLTATVYTLTAKNATNSVSKSASVSMKTVPTPPSEPTGPTDVVSPPTTEKQLSVDVLTSVGEEGPNTPVGIFKVGEEVIVYLSFSSTCEAVLFLQGPYNLKKDLGKVAVGLQKVSLGLAESRDIGIWDVTLEARVDGQQASAATTFSVEAQTPAPTAPAGTSGILPLDITVPPGVSSCRVLAGGARAVVSLLIFDGGEVPSVTLYWGTSDGGTNPDGWAKQHEEGFRTGWLRTSLIHLQSGTTYYLQCRATNSAGSAWLTSSAEFRTSIGIPAPPPEPVPQIDNLPATNVTGTSATLNGYLFSDGGTPTSITVYWSPSAPWLAYCTENWEHNVPLGTQPVGNLSTTITGLFPDTAYGYYYYATNSAGSSQDSSPQCVTFRTAPPPPTAPSNLKAKEVGNPLLGEVYPLNKVKLTWRDNSTTESGFNIYISVGGLTSFHYMDHVGANVNSYEIRGLPIGIVQCFRVKAYNRNGESGYSESCASIFY